MTRPEPITLATYRPREAAFHRRQLARIAAASLPRRTREPRDAHPDKHEAPETLISRASTDLNTIAGCLGGCCLHGKA